MRVKIWIVHDYIRYSFSKALYFLLLAFGLILPWRMRIRYSEFLVIYGSRIKAKVLYLPYDAHLSRALQYFKQNKFDVALSEFNKTEEFDQQDGDIDIHIARCYGKLGREEEYVSGIIKGVIKNKKFIKGTWKSGELTQPKIDLAEGTGTKS
jgi:hypothetical protein